MKYLTLLFLIVASAARGTTYYVATNGSNANPGTFAQPFLTAQFAFNATHAGDTLIFAAGYWAEDVLTNNNGTNTARITIDGQGVGHLRSMLVRNPYMTFQNLIFGSRTNGYLVYVERSCDFCVFTNNLFDNEFRTGNALNWNAPATKPFGDAGSDNLFINNTFTHGLGSVALAMFGDRNEVRGNLFYNSDSIDFMRIFGRSNHIIGNTFSNVYESGASGNHIDFFQLFGTQGYGARGHIIENNIVTDMSESSQLCMMTADDIVDIQDITFRNNLFVGVAAKGTICIRNVKWYNNMFYNCSTTALTAGHALIFISLTNATYTNFLSNAAHGCEVKNNAFISCGDARTTVGWYSFTLDLTNIVADYNIVSKNGYNPVTTNTLHRPIGGTNAWDSLKWWEDHGINGGNPQYTDPPGMDFRFPEGSIVRGVALEMNSLFTTDFYGTVRGDEWDIGPIEFNGDAPPLICVPYY